MPFSDHDEEKLPGKSILHVIWDTLRTIVKVYLLGAGLFFTGMVVLFTVLILSLMKSDQKKAPPVEDSKNIVIHLTLEGLLTDKPQEFEQQLIGRLFGSPEPITMAKVRQALRRVIKDKKVSGVLVEYGSLAAEDATITELRRLLQEVRDSGKKVYGWGADLDTEPYYLLSVSDQFFIAPAGGLDITGPVFQLVYFGEALRKLGVDIEVMKAGKYKSAFEPLVMNEPSAPVLEMYHSMEESLRAFYAEDIAANRNKPVETVREWLKKSIYTAKDAKADGLVDDIAFLDEVRTKIEDAMNKKDEPVKFLTLKRYLRVSEGVEAADTAGGDEGIALLQARGEIVMHDEGGSEDIIDPAQMHREIEWAMNDDDVKSVVLRIDSPGGSATASDLIWRDLKRLSLKKPLVVSMAGVAASGGYYLSVAGQKIYAEPTTITGSIGVIGMVPNFEAFKEKYGVSFFIVTQTDRAKLLNPGEKSTAFDKAIVENSIEATYQTFLQRVSEGRGMAVEQVNELAQGRVYSGREALELKLVDDLGGLNDAFRKAKELANLDPNKLYNVFQYEGEDLNISDCLTEVSNMMECISELDGTHLGRRLLSLNNPLDLFPGQQEVLDRLRHMAASKEKVFAMSPPLKRLQ